MTWHDLAACAGDHVGKWFPDDHHQGAKAAAIARAVATCRRCPVQAACLAEALANGERHGVWGGQFMGTTRTAADPRPKRTTQQVERDRLAQQVSA